MAEAMELRAFYARYPFDDESNHWLPNGMLQAQIAGLLAGKGSTAKTAFDFMPFRPKDESDSHPLLDNWDAW
jgi:hypothetical protein